MSNTILNKPSGVQPSSAIEPMQLSVDTSSVEFSLTNEAGTALLTETYYPIGGNVTIYDLNEIIESDMRNRGLVFATYMASIGNDFCSLSVIYCERTVNREDFEAWLASHFLTTLENRRIAPDSTVEVKTYVAALNRCSIGARLVWRNLLTGNLTTYSSSRSQFALSKSPKITHYSVHVDSLVQTAAKEAHIDARYVEPLCIVIDSGNRELTCFIDKSLRYSESFTFRSCFNTLETAMLPAWTNTKTETARTLAVFNGRSEFFDRTVSKVFEENVGPLTSDEADWVDQLISSHEVYHFAGVGDMVLHPILITGATCEVNNGNEAPNAVKFTWRFAENRPHLNLWNMSETRIFSKQFNELFS